MVVLSRFKNIIANAYNYKSALDRENIDQTHVNLFREKVRSSECVPKYITDRQVLQKAFVLCYNRVTWWYFQLLLFLKAGEENIEKSSKLIHNFYEIKRSTPKFFANRDVESREFQDCLDNQDYVRLPVTPNNEYFIFHRLSNHNPKYYSFDAAAKTFIMLVESDFYHQGPRDGIVFMFDMNGVGFKHLFKPSISSMRAGIKFLEKGLPTEIKAVHVLNAGFIFEKILGKLIKIISISILFYDI